MNTPDLSIVIPAFHEADRLGESLDALAKYVNADIFNVVEVIVVAADSTDGTADIARDKRSLFPRLHVFELSEQNGKGADVQHGMYRATGRYRMFMDADMATPLHHLHIVKAHMNQNADIIIGVRDLQESHTGFRKWISSMGNIPIRWLLSLGIRDTQCGFKVFRDDVADVLFPRQTIPGWGFDIELLAIAKKHGYTVTTIPLPDWQDVAGSALGNTAVTGAISTLRDLVKIRWNMWGDTYD